MTCRQLARGCGSQSPWHKDARRFSVRCVSLLATCGVIIVLLYATARRYTQTPRAQSLDDDWYSTAEPYTDFIDPDLASLLRMFYNGLLARPRSHGGRPSSTMDEQHGSPLPAANVTVFEPKETNHNICVPFFVPGNRTLKICIYDPKVDTMISSYINDYGIWEKEQVEAVASMLLKSQRDQGTDPRIVPQKQQDLEPGTSQNAGLTGLQKEQHSELRTGRQRHHQGTDLRTATGEKTQQDTAARGAAVEPHGDWLAVVDVGCSVGVYTLTATALGHRVLAVDPVRSNLQLLTTSLRRAGLSHRATLLLNAVSDRRGPVSVRVNPANVGGSSVLHVPRKGGGGSGRAVYAVCLDDLLPWVPGRRVVLKMDIEGGEVRAFRCAGRFFQQVDVRAVVMEWTFTRHARDGGEVVDFLVRNGFLPYDTRLTGMLHPDLFYSWPNDVFWLKR